MVGNGHMQDWQDIAAVQDLREGEMTSLQLGDRPLVLCRTAAGWFALDDLCTHAEARLSEGQLKGCRLVCPLHGAAFDIRSGEALGPPAREALRTYPVRIENGKIQACLPR